MEDYTQLGSAKMMAVELGVNELERIPNPVGKIEPWLIIKDTTIGMPENRWRLWINGHVFNREDPENCGKPTDWGEFEIVLEENGELVPPNP
jgi:hypothetical protein